MSNMQSKGRLWGFLSFFCGAFILDQVSKWVALYFLDASKEIPVLPGFNLALSFNRGVSFSFFSENSSWGKFALIGVIVLLLGFFIVHSFVEWRRGTNILPEVLVLAGGISNVLDRFVHGAVVDFVQLHALGYYFPTFNFADVFICFGVFLIVARVIWEGNESKSS